MLKVNSSKSKSNLVTSSVRQRSVLGPLLFLVYIPDLPHVAKHSELFVHASGCKISVSASRHRAVNLDRLQDDLNCIYNWVRGMQLTRSLIKCEL